MNMFDEARSILTMLKMRSMTQSEIAEKLGVSQPYIANKLRLLSYSPECEEMIIRYGLTERHARTILRLCGEENRRSAIERVHTRTLTVSECEGMVDMMREDDLPRALEHEIPTRRLSKFIDGLDRSVRTLRGLGYNISKKTSYREGRTYITVSVDESRKHDNF